MGSENLGLRRIQKIAFDYQHSPSGNVGRLKLKADGKHLKVSAPFSLSA
jgi:hypothetical protein